MTLTTLPFADAQGKIRSRIFRHKNRKRDQGRGSFVSSWPPAILRGESTPHSYHSDREPDEARNQALVACRPPFGCDERSRKFKVFWDFQLFMLRDQPLNFPVTVSTQTHNMLVMPTRPEKTSWEYVMTFQSGTHITGRANAYSLCHLFSFQRSYPLPLRLSCL